MNHADVVEQASQGTAAGGLSSVISAVLSAAQNAPWWAILLWSLVLVFVMAGLPMLRVVLDHLLIADLSRRSLDKVGNKGTLADLESIVRALRPEDSNTTKRRIGRRPRLRRRSR